MSYFVVVLVFGLSLLLRCCAITGEHCSLQEHNRFIKKVCFHPETGVKYLQCFASDTNYTTFISRIGRERQPAVDKLCPNDPTFYQACGLDRMEQLEFSPSPCGTVCGPRRDGNYIVVNDLASKVCLAGQHAFYPNQGNSTCTNVDVQSMQQACEEEDTMCDGIITNRAQYKINDPYDHEMYCNGFMYGVVSSDKGDFIEARHINCYEWGVQSSRDEAIIREMCENGTVTGYCHPLFYEDILMPLFNFSRCGPIGRVNYWSLNMETHFLPICTDFRDQTNCSDVARVGLICEIDGYPSSVADQIICKKGSLLPRVALCDDKLDVACQQLSITCFIHKHRFCDGVEDCYDGIDETHCSDTTNKTCARRLGSQEKLGIPFSWIKDGVYDCMAGEDENGEWPTCGIGNTKRLSSTEVCTDVYLCESGIVQFSELCDGIDTCGNENEVCRKSRNIHSILGSPPNVGGRLKLFHCLDGLEYLGEMVDGGCSNTKFSFPNNQVFGKNSFIELTLPTKSRIDCRYVHGAIYVYMSCLDLCITSACIISDLVRADSCRFRFEERVYSITHDRKLTFLVKNRADDTYHNDIFPCDNGNCVDYDKVCNIVDDCGDGTDERSCTNHFRCHSGTDMIPLTKLCDGKIDCFDYSDECSEWCSSNNWIIRNLVVAVLGWVLGVFAVVFNLCTIPASVESLIGSKTDESLANRTLLVLINFGDLMVGAFVLIVSVLNVIYGSSYCKLRFEWLTSHTCTFIGVMNSVGNQVSVLSMTALSLTRLRSVSRSLSLPSPIDRKGAAQIISLVFLIIGQALFISLIPLAEPFEDYFVNGMYHGTETPLFLGAQDKKSHIAILEAYYGRLRFSEALSWRLVRHLLSRMFSSDYSEFPNREIQFYGNDPVCTFKYMVRREDPQFEFVWMSHIIQIACFSTISLSYTFIASISTRRRVLVADRKTERRLERRAQKVQRSAALIILTDFVSWIPFIIVCILHSLEVFDATNWYSIFSLIINPWNSVLNAILLNQSLKEKFVRMLNEISKSLGEFNWSRRGHGATPNIDLQSR